MLSLVTFSILIIFLVSAFSLAPWVPTKTQDLERVHSIASLKPGERFIEIGCGDAKVCHYIATKNPESAVVGIELNPCMYAIAKVRNIISPRENLRIYLANLYHFDLSPFDVIYVFGFPETNKKYLKAKLEKELKDGAKILSYVFEIEGWKGKVRKEKPEGKLSIFVYTK